MYRQAKASLHVIETGEDEGKQDHTEPGCKQKRRSSTQDRLFFSLKRRIVRRIKVTVQYARLAKEHVLQLLESPNKRVEKPRADHESKTTEDQEKKSEEKALVNDRQ